MGAGRLPPAGSLRRSAPQIKGIDADSFAGGGRPAERENETVKLIRTATAGTLESSDIYVKAGPREGGREIQIQSIVFQQFGDAIQKTISEVLDQFGVTDASVEVVDRGALDCTIRARVETALKRAGKEAGK